MCHKYTVERGTKRWPLCIFYGMVDIAAINALSSGKRKILTVIRMNDINGAYSRRIRGKFSLISSGFSLKNLNKFTYRYSKCISCRGLSYNRGRSANENDVQFAIFLEIEKFQNIVTNVQSLFVTNIL